MNSLSIIVLFATVAVTLALTEDPALRPFRAFQAKHNKAYSSPAEEVTRFTTFKANLAKISKHNALADLGLKNYRLGVTAFTDLTAAEFTTSRKGFKQAAGSKKFRSFNGHKNTFTSSVPLSALPTSVDWRTKGIVTPIKDQGQCGSCWAFSAVASLEGQHALANGKLVSLSEQNLVDCSGDEGDEGCNGGLMDNAFQYIIDAKGLDTEASYPYEAVDDSCRFKSANVGATVTGFTDIPTGNETALTAAIAAIGPISVAIDASSEDFQLYTSGVYDPADCSTEFLDHGVTAVGYATTSDGQDYYLVKNSWGSSWGQAGYIWMARNKGNVCGIATESSYPLVK